MGSPLSSMTSEIPKIHLNNFNLHYEKNPLADNMKYSHRYADIIYSFNDNKRQLNKLNNYLSKKDPNIPFNTKINNNKLL